MLRPVPKERRDDGRVVRFADAQASRPGGHEPPVEGPQPTLRPVISPSSVGATLSITREKFGQELKQVAQALRIRLSYLEAIEDDRYADLPGLTYAVGFVRSYADYVGLDSKLLVERYKDEAQGLNRRTQLVFPTPAAEAKVPTGAIILVALILIGLTYVGWTYFSDEAPPPAVAEQQQPPTAPAPAPAPTPAPLAGGTATDSSAQAPAPAPSGASAEPAPAPEPAGTTAAPAPAPAPVPDATAAIASEAQPESPSAAQSAAPMAPAPAPAPAPALVGAPPAPPAPAATSAATTTTATTAPGEQQAVLPPPLPEAVEAAHQPRLLILAEQDSWVQIRNAKDEAILTQVLREGEIYEVPEEQGLVLLTGNAGGIVLVLEGEPLPPLGPVGAVRRNIALDPEALRSQ